MKDLNVGDKFELDYPFKLITIHNVNGNYGDVKDYFWVMGCNKTTETYSPWEYEHFYTCDGIGKIIFEVLSICEMPRKYKSRVIYKFDRIDPDGKLIKSSKCHMATLSKFKEMIENPYRHEYEVSDD